MTIGARFNYIWRLFGTALSFAVFGIGGILIPLVVAPLLYLGIRNRQRRQSVARHLVHRIFRAFVYMMRGLGILRWRTSGLERLERRGLLILANHPTLIDVVFLVAFIPDATCIVKGRLLGNPAMRGLISLAGYITNERGDDLLKDAATTLNRGGNLVIFPEGTRTRADRPLSFQRGAANVSVRCHADITPVIIHCSPPTLSKEHKWYHIPKRPFVMAFTVEQDIDISPFLTETAPVAARRLTAYLEGYFTQRYQSDDNHDPGERTQDADYRVPGFGGYLN